ncbi:MAG: hypothetical protein GY940_40985, partial [bacterium]|nr:hypothetical protein [bacterium]
MMQKTRLMVDGHVHIYDCYHLEKFFRTAVAHLDHFYNTLYSNGSPYVKLLLLTEAKSNDYFNRFREGEGFPNDSGYHFLETNEPTSIILAKEGKPQCYLLRGRQIVTRDDLEILSIGSDQFIQDGLPTETVTDTLIAHEEPAVLA